MATESTEICNMTATKRVRLKEGVQFATLSCVQSEKIFGYLSNLLIPSPLPVSRFNAIQADLPMEGYDSMAPAVRD